MKKFALFFSLILILALFPAPASAAANAVFSLKPAEGQIRQGDTVTITGSLAATEPVAAFDIIVTYPASVLQHTASKRGSALDSSDDFTIDQPGDKAAGRIQVLYVDGDGGESGVQKGTLFSLTFKVIGGKPGDSLSLGMEFRGVANKDIAEMQPSASSGKMVLAAPLSSNASLKELSISPGRLEPAFSPDITTYNVQVANDVPRLTLKASPADSQAKLASKNPDLKAGSTTSLSVTVTAPSGASRTYTINVKREAGKASPTKETSRATTSTTTARTTQESQSQESSSATSTSSPTSQATTADLSDNNNLARLQVSSGRLAPAFSAQVTDYKVEVPAEISSVNLTASPVDRNAKVEIINHELKPGPNELSVIVTAPSGAKKTYKVMVTRASKQSEAVISGNSELEDLAVEGFVLSPPFSPDKTEYIVYLPYEADKVKVKAVAREEKARTTVTGNDHLKANEANIITVEAQATGAGKKTYTIIAMRADQFSGMASLPQEELPLAGPGQVEAADDGARAARTSVIYKILIIVLATIAIVEGIVLFARRKKIRL